MTRLNDLMGPNVFAEALPVPAPEEFGLNVVKISQAIPTTPYETLGVQSCCDQALEDNSKLIHGLVVAGTVAIGCMALYGVYKAGKSICSAMARKIEGNAQSTTAANPFDAAQKCKISFNDGSAPIIINVNNGASIDLRGRTIKSITLV